MKNSHMVVLEELESDLGASIPSVDEINWNSFGFTSSGGELTGLGVQQGSEAVAHAAMGCRVPRVSLVD